MKFDYSILDDTERIIFALRALYDARGYRRYKMSKFEEYDLYARHKDFLVSDAVITFTDTNGKLMALKPDVTLSIVKNNPTAPGETRKLFYNENVYRVSKGTNSFKEIMQTGLECIGNVDTACISEVLLLAAESLRTVSRNYALEISDLSLLSAFTDGLTDDQKVMGQMMKCVQEKNLHGLTELLGRCEETLPEKGGDTSERGRYRERAEALKKLLQIYGCPEKVLPPLTKLCAGNPAAEQALGNLVEAVSVFDGTPMEASVQIDFSCAADMNYYNGIVFRGFLDGVPESVLSGGQYDVLMRKMGRQAGAVGFAVYLDLLERITLPED